MLSSVFRTTMDSKPTEGRAATRDVMVRVLRTELPTPLRHYHAHLGQGWPAGTPEPANSGWSRPQPAGYRGFTERKIASWRQTTNAVPSAGCAF